MSEALKVSRIKPYTPIEASDMLDKHDKMLAEIYPVGVVINKVWKYLKYATPAMVLALLGNINPASPIGKAITNIWGLLTSG